MTDPILTETTPTVHSSWDGNDERVEIEGEKVKNDYDQSGDFGEIKIDCDMGNISVYTK